MANVENIEKRLSDIIKTEDAFALALTGDWGIGKTYLWKNFRDKNRESFSTPLSTYFSKVLVYLVFKISVKTIRILNSIKIKGLR